MLQTANTMFKYNGGRIKGTVDNSQVVIFVGFDDQGSETQYTRVASFSPKAQDLRTSMEEGVAKAKRSIDNYRAAEELRRKAFRVMTDVFKEAQA